MAVEFTPEELKAILLEAGLPESESAALAAQLALGAAAFDELEELLFQQLSAGVTPEMLAAARAQATREAKRITGNLLQAELHKIAEQVAENLAAGKGPLELARRLEAIKALDSNRAKTYLNYEAMLEATDLTAAEIEAKLERMYEKLLRDRKETIAITEQRMATSEANALEAEARGQKFKRWSTVGDARVSTEICAPNEAQGWIDIDRAFQSGDDHTPGHPNCRCSVIYRTSEPDKFDRARAQEQADRTEAALDAAQ